MNQTFNSKYIIIIDKVINILTNYILYNYYVINVRIIQTFTIYESNF